MTIVRDISGRIPGPFGMMPFGTGGNFPTQSNNVRGPAGYRPLFAGPGVPATTATKVRTFEMPRALDDVTSKKAHRIDWKLFGSSGPKPTDVSQGALPNCPLAALLGAMANTSSGRKRIQDLVTEHSDAAVTNLAGVADQLTEQGSNNIASTRYFTVNLGKSIEVSDVFYTNDADSGWSLLYMQAPDSGTPVLWACVIEKAYAVMLGGYPKLDKMSLNTVWKVVMGTDPNGFAVTEKTDLERIRKAATNATNVPTVAASRDDKSIEKL